MTSKGENPFLDEDEIDDYEFLNHPQQGPSGYIFENENSETREPEEYDARQIYLMEQRRRIQERTIQSTHTSLGLLHESEQVGVATAEELVKQREQLQNVERNLDDISSTMRISQKHINSIKSVFGGIKSFFGKGNSSDPTKNMSPAVAPIRSQSGLQETVCDLKSNQKDYSTTHPALRTRGIEYEDEEEEVDFTKPAPPDVPRLKTTMDFEEKLDKNLVDISMGIGRLKNLAIGLNEEIEDQNIMLDRVNLKTDHADETLEYQNRQIKRILKK